MKVCFHMNVLVSFVCKGMAKRLSLNFIASYLFAFMEVLKEFLSPLWD